MRGSLTGKRIQTKGLHNEALRCRGVCLCVSVCMLWRTVTHWLTRASAVPLPPRHPWDSSSHEPPVFRASPSTCASFLCEQSDEINITHIPAVSRGAEEVLAVAGGTKACAREIKVSANLKLVCVYIDCFFPSALKASSYLGNQIYTSGFFFFKGILGFALIGTKGAYFLGLDLYSPSNSSLLYLL